MKTEKFTDTSDIANSLRFMTLKTGKYKNPKW